MDAVFDALRNIDAAAVVEMIARYGDNGDNANSNALKDLLFVEPLPACVAYARKHDDDDEKMPTGDVLVGFYADREPARFTVTIDDNSICTHDLKAGDFAFAHEGRFVIPHISISYSAIRLCRNDDDSRSASRSPLWIVYAHLQSSERWTLWNEGSHCLLNDGLYARYDGIYSRSSSASAKGIELPDLSRNQMDAVFDALRNIDAAAVVEMIAWYGGRPLNKFTSISLSRPHPLLDIIKTPPPVCVAFAERLFIINFIDIIVPRNGDVLVGFYADREPARFKVSIGDRDACTHDLKAGEFAFAHEGRFVIPLISLWTDVRVRLSRDLDDDIVPVCAVYAFLQCPERKALYDDGRLLSSRDASQNA